MVVQPKVFVLKNIFVLYSSLLYIFILLLKYNTVKNYFKEINKTVKYD